MGSNPATPTVLTSGVAERTALTEHAFDGHVIEGAALCAIMKTLRTWLAFRREGRGLSLWAVARGWS